MENKNLQSEPFLILKFSRLGDLKISKPKFCFFCFGLVVGAAIGVIAAYN